MSVTKEQIAHLKEHQAEFEEAFPDYTVDEYVDEYDDSEHPDLYIGMCSDMGIEPREESPVMVTWTLPIDEAREVWEFLRRYRPGGHQHVHDSLFNAISEAADNG